ncbi:MAG: orotidine-5'-phosphate decarboxylase [Deferribacteres bacterium]|nr:orotidine-5'-phosphate decarboxylase [candidate division KSB1 bacterium]MCB9512241.1 orotidine-5'-phosphate decarboxylase [Deferribacteres bacterium]
MTDSTQQIESYSAKLTRLQKAKKSLLCVGIDPEYDKLPKRFADDKDWLFKFCHVMIKSTMQYAVAYKFNFAFFEVMGSQGWETLQRLLEIVPKDCITIADAKRGDIGNSARQYAKAILEEMAFDAVTVNPYMGHDAVEPFLADPGKGVYCLCLTSNAGAKDLQYLLVDEQPLFKHVGALVQKWNAAKNCGIVVGATKPAHLKELRQQYPDMPFLIPGVGAQGGSLNQVLEIVNGSNALINASRSIIYASANDDFAQAAAHEAAMMQANMAKNF